MGISTVAHINLRGTAREALEFYRTVFGGDLVAVTYADAHSVPSPDEADQIMWGQVTSPEGFQIMAYDVPSSRPWSAGDSPFFVSVRGSDADEITGYWKRLSEGSAVVVELGPAGWAPLYGMVTDRFGVTWVLDVAINDR
ncbi:PhnB protein [Actinoplanes lutulentus]|uniref:PhnB protein n=1 Tax=Actinoplanes lutulentus TaxID=1287878 RepID=A0A327Z4E6_9ACTN|nr:VOC family protein [Actinoplanes lutulentus]MBB2947000.1 PhnB protein [Actinoplanes lutulentus]RAK30501.1 PhnB protein [Actinoplanes lutulentus]